MSGDDGESKTVDVLIDAAEQIGVIGSPSSTGELALDILGTAVNKKLVGEMALFRYMQDGTSHYPLGQITEVTLRNIWHEDPTMRSLIRQRGRVDAVSERQDTHQAEMTVSAVFAREAHGFKPSILGTVPATGTRIHLADDNVLQTLLSPYRKELFYLGNVYGSKPRLPLWFKHFGVGERGAGEAYHIGIFGKTGSGKSVLAKMVLLAYARHPEMGLLVIDPQGEFAKDVRGDPAPSSFRLPLKEVLEGSQRQVRVYGVRDIVLDRWELFESILLVSGFPKRLAIKHPDNQRDAVGVIREILQGRVKLSALWERPTFDAVMQGLTDERHLSRVYSTAGKREDVLRQIESVDATRLYEEIWKPATELFRENRQNAEKVNAILFRLLQPASGSRPIVVIDLSAERLRGARPQPSQEALAENNGEDAPAVGLLWNETIQALVIKRLLEGIGIAAEEAYKDNRSLNTLVLLDESHRLAPREEPGDQEQQGVRAVLIDAVRTTRKYGVGWLFISQTLSSLHKEIIDQLRIFFFGFGLGMGSEFRALSDLVGGRSKALDLYQLFRDPHSSFDASSREYSFMTIGPVSPLSFSGTPLFFNAYTTPIEFLRQNGLRSEDRP